MNGNKEQHQIGFGVTAIVLNFIFLLLDFDVDTMFYGTVFLGFYFIIGLLSMIYNKLNNDETYRHADNPEEKHFHDAALDMGTRYWSAVTLPLNHRGTEPSRYLNQDEEQLVINTLQWLGSPVGQSWLREMGYEKQEPKK